MTSIMITKCSHVLYSPVADVTRVHRFLVVACSDNAISCVNLLLSNVILTLLCYLPIVFIEV